jgi:hypothetical protein
MLLSYNAHTINIKATYPPFRSKAINDWMNKYKFLFNIHREKNSIKWFIWKNFLTLNKILQFERKYPFSSFTMLSFTPQWHFQINILHWKERNKRKAKEEKNVFVLLTHSLSYSACRLLFLSLFCSMISDASF